MIRLGLFFLVVLSVCDTTAYASYTLSYDPIDGSLTIAADGDLGGYDLIGSGIFEASHTPPPGMFDFSSEGSTSGLTGLSFSTAAAPAGIYNIGDVMSPGLTEAEFLSGIVVAQYSTEPGSFSGPSFELTYVPEPNSAIALVVAASVLMRRGRSRLNSIDQ